MFDKHRANQAVEEIKKGRNCIFAGAGVSMEAQLPGWQDALENMATYIGDFDSPIKSIMLDRISKKSLLDAAELYFMSDITDDIKMRGLEIIFGKKPLINDNLKLLMGLHINKFITTNYDSTIEDIWSLTKKGSIPSLSNNKEDFLSAHRLITQNKDFVIHIHGTIYKPSSIVICKSHYDKLKRLDNYFHFLRDLLMNSSIFFIGFSFIDPGLISFLEYTKDNLNLICENPSFAILAEEDKDLNSLLIKANIVPIFFKKDGDYSNLWRCIRWMKEQLKKTKIPQITILPENEEILKLKYNLASVYTHFKIKRTYKTIYDTILNGIVHFAGYKLNKQGHDTNETTIARYIAAFLHVSEIDAILLVRKSMDALIKDKQASLDGENYNFSEIKDYIDNDMNIIVKSIKDRCKIRYLHNLTIPEDQIREFLTIVLVTDGVRLAHSILTEYPIPSAPLEEVLEIIFNLLFDVRHREKDAFKKSVWSLFQSPTKIEAQILGTISRIAFLTDLCLHEPDLRSINLKKSIQYAYLDASVVLPFICSYHPRTNYYSSLIKLAQKNGISIRVSTSFLEEVVSHREIAIRTFDMNFKSNEKRFNNYVLFNGSDNINVFLGGFSAWLKLGKNYDLHEYLNESAPYKNISELIAYLEEKGIQGSDPVRELSLETGKIARWNASIKSWYQENGKQKANSLIWHEAVQLEALSIENSKGKSSIFLTADKGLINATMEAAFEKYLDPKVVHYLVMPIQFSYYIDMDEERKIDWRAYSRILWSKAFREHHEKYTEYYTDKILHEYEPKLVSSIPKIIQSIHKEIEIAPKGKEIPSEEDLKLQELKYLEDFEERFYAIMNEEKEKHDLK